MSYFFLLNKFFFHIILSVFEFKVNLKFEFELNSNDLNQHFEPETDFRQILADFAGRIRVKLKPFKHKYNSIARNYVYFTLYGRDGPGSRGTDISLQLPTC